MSFVEPEGTNISTALSLLLGPVYIFVLDTLWMLKTCISLILQNNIQGSTTIPKSLSLDCPFLNGPSVFSNVYLYILYRLCLV